MNSKLMIDRFVKQYIYIVYRSGEPSLPQETIMAYFSSCMASCDKFHRSSVKKGKVIQGH